MKNPVRNQADTSGSFNKLSQGDYSNSLSRPIVLASMAPLFQPPASLSVRIQTAQKRMLDWLECGMEPRQLSFTLALGFAIGCIPLLGVTTGICAVAALALRLNMPAMQAANWLAMPVQVLLLVPFLRFGQWLFPGHTPSFNRSEILSRLQAAPWRALMQMGSLFEHGVLAWLIAAAPALVLMTLLLTPLMHRVSRLASAQAHPIS